MLKQLEKIGTLEDVQHYPCKVVSLSFSHTMLGIQIHHHTLSLYWQLTFLGVHYFQGPMFWTGANFVEASQELTFEVWDRTHLSHSDPSTRIFKYERLYRAKLCPVYVLEMTPHPILIASGGISLSEIEYRDE